MNDFCSVLIGVGHSSGLSVRENEGLEVLSRDGDLVSATRLFANVL